MIIWKQIKVYLFLGLGALVAALAASTKYYSGKAKKEKKGRKQAEASVDYALKVIKEDDEIDTEFKSRRAEALAEVEAGKPPTVFSDPNKLFDNPDSD